MLKELRVFFRVIEFGITKIFDKKECFQKMYLTRLALKLQMLRQKYKVALINTKNHVYML